MQRRLILCGTLYGSLLIFSADSGASESTSNAKSVANAKSVTKVNEKKSKSRKLPPKHSKLEFDSKPLAKLKVSNSAIVQVKPDRKITRLWQQH